MKIALRTMLTELKENKVSVEMLLKQLHRVSLVDFQMDQDAQVWYVGMQKKTEKVLEQTGRKNSLVRGSSMLVITLKLFSPYRSRFISQHRLLPSDQQ
ncbi:hypothetical protein DLD82_11575 [Methanospirillum stamsii]|uniref:Uncharacterized protein n=1 Tax=Methanospirillum stamsii TaxID=1277351 RepID=A0A2V2NC69_9EURY|nr:hypothetical protein DLD82_11575 [Methanospirillum stamsii]